MLATPLPARGCIPVRLAKPNRRRSRRSPCGRTVLFRPAGVPRPTAWPAVVRDLSPSGLGLMLDFPCPVGSVLVVWQAGPEGQPLLGRVVRLAAAGRHWMHGCELARPLDDSEVQCWLG